VQPWPVEGDRRQVQRGPDPGQLSEGEQHHDGRVGRERQHDVPAGVLGGIVVRELTTVARAAGAHSRPLVAGGVLAGGGQGRGGGDSSFRPRPPYFVQQDDHRR